jgi:dipeptidyl aminopeptidase/acylaminoacyl peptidase
MSQKTKPVRVEPNPSSPADLTLGDSGPGLYLSTMATQTTRLLDAIPVEITTHLTRVVKQMYGMAVLEEAVVEQITYLSDGLKVKGYSARPKEPGVYPTLIWNRGGNGDYGSLDDLTAYLILASTAVWGYVVLATQYRGNKGGEGVEDWGGNDVNDAFNLIELAKQIPECDMSRIAVEGASRGGMTTYRLLTMYDQFKCAIVHAGISDVRTLMAKKEKFATFVTELLASKTEAEREAELDMRSGVVQASRFPKSTPILLMHGDQDKSVPMEQSIVMHEKLDKVGVPNEFHILEGAGHVALKDGSYRRIDELRKEWLERYLK